ncbi:MAG: hypothetical protein JWP11_1166 [Frankiales bacterium]|nr:hypothetical protein [Frankiales bacterium]
MREHFAERRQHQDGPADIPPDAALRQRRAEAAVPRLRTALDPERADLHQHGTARPSRRSARRAAVVLGASAASAAVPELHVARRQHGIGHHTAVGPPVRSRPRVRDPLARCALAARLEGEDAPGTGVVGLPIEPAADAGQDRTPAAGGSRAGESSHGRVQVRVALQKPHFLRARSMPHDDAPRR